MTRGRVPLREGSWAMGVIAAGAALCATLAAGRRFCTFGTETDFLAEGIAEAQRILRLEPLSLDVHPPGHAAAIALLHLLVPSWVADGLILSWVASVVVLALCFRLFRSVGGRAAAWGSLLGLLLSVTFVAYAAQATSDVFFLALVVTALFLCERALRSGSGLGFALLGGAVGLCLLTRANGLTLLLLFVAPWLRREGRAGAPAQAARMVIGFLVPVLLWVGFAWLTGSPLTPRKTYADLAQTYFPGGTDRVSGDVQARAAEQFHGALDVLLRDPLHVARVYVRDLSLLPRTLFLHDALLGFPFMLFALPGTLLFLLSVRSSFLALYVAATAAQLLLVNLKAYESRYYLFLVPLLGAGVGWGVARLLEALPDRRARLAAGAALVLLLAIGGWDSYTEVVKALHAQDAELGEAVPAVREEVGPADAVVARKAHVPFYTGTSWIAFPDVASWDALEAALLREGKGRAVHVYYGSAERYYRDQFAALAGSGERPAWLRPEARSREPGGWILYRFEPSP